MPQVFPFGAPLRDVMQIDRGPKRLFVLGVYASAVHAEWKDAPFGGVTALAVASEPYIFWRGDGAENVIREIELPEGCGRLIPADDKFNGPSGRSLDQEVLQPLGGERSDAWLCDLVPHSCVNESQALAIYRSYLPAVQRFGLPLPTVPTVPSRLSDSARVKAILSELEESQAETIVLLGDEPLRWFLRPAAGSTVPKTLDEFCATASYGGRLVVDLAGKRRDVVALAHPRQISRLGRSSEKWFARHRDWKAGFTASAV